MEQRKRMLGTLACLIVSMTGTAALLGWIDPSRSALAVPLTAGESAHSTDGAILDGVAFRAERWTGVDVVLFRQRGTKWNDPTVDMPLGHLYVDESGGIYHDELWLEQSPVNKQSQSIQIIVCLGELHSSMNLKQQATLKVLYSELDAAIQASQAAPLPIRYLAL